jgi:hypothetical protein
VTRNVTRYFILFAGLLLASSVCTAQSADDFNRPDTQPSADASVAVGSGWLNGGDPAATFRIQNQEVSAQSTPPRTAFLLLSQAAGTHNADGKKFTITGTIKLNSTTATAVAGLVFNYADRENYYAFRLNGAGRVQVIRRVNGAESAILNVADAFTFVKNHPYDLAVSSAKPGLFDVAVRDAENGQTVFSKTGASDSTKSFKDGSGGFYAGGGAATFDNFRLDGTASAGKPQPVVKSAAPAATAPVETGRIVIDARGAGLHPDYDRFKNWGGVSPDGHRLSANNYYFELDGKPLALVSGEFHPMRYPVEYWEEAILKMKAAGLNAVSSYIFWSQLEPRPGEFDFSGQKNVRRFGELCAKHGMYWLIRPGPYCNSEFLLGGLPAWLYGKPLVERSDDPLYLELVGRYFTKLGEHLTGLFWEQGGPIISTQLENELGTAPTSWDRIFVGDIGTGYIGPRGAEFEKHYRELKKCAVQGGLRSPFFTCTGWTLKGPLPVDEMYPTDGGYMYLSRPKNENHWLTTFGRGLSEYFGKVPIGFSEIGTGSPARFSYRPDIPPEGIYGTAFSRLAGTEALLFGYYMFHGGSNPMDATHGFTHKNNTLPAITYDFYAPIGEFGEWRESLYRLRPLNQFITSYGSELSCTETRHPGGKVVTATEDRLRSDVRMSGGSGFLFFSNYGNVKPLSPRSGVQFEVTTDDGPVILPRQDGLDIPTGSFGIFPVNLDLDGVRLISATAQPGPRFRHQGESWAVFSQTGTLPCEFVFAQGTVIEKTGASVEAVRTEQKDGALVFNVRPGHAEAFQLRSGDGRRTHVLLLSEKDARHAALLTSGERTVLAVSPHPVILNGATLRITETATNVMTLCLFPALTKNPGHVQIESDGVFQRLTMTVPARELRAAFTDFSAGKKVLKLAEAEFAGLNDIYLQIDSSGTACRIFDIRSGLLVADHLNNSELWRVGLKRFRSALAGDGLWLRAEPEVFSVGDTSSDMVLFDPSTGGKAGSADFREVRIIPEYRADIDL